MKKFTRVRDRLVYENQYIELYDDDVITPEGVPGHYVRLRNRGNPPGAIVVPRFDDGRLLLIETCRYAFDSLSPEFPRGAAVPGESAEDAARRELREETNLRAESLRRVGVLRPDTGILETEAHVFVAEVGAWDPSALRLDEKEAIASSRRVTMAELARMITASEVRCGFTVGAFGLMVAEGMH